jgi:hypothetical protein
MKKIKDDTLEKPLWKWQHLMFVITSEYLQKNDYEFEEIKFQGLAHNTNLVTHFKSRFPDLNLSHYEWIRNPYHDTAYYESPSLKYAGPSFRLSWYCWVYFLKCKMLCGARNIFLYFSGGAREKNVKEILV